MRKKIVAIIAIILIISGGAFLLLIKLGTNNINCPDINNHNKSLYYDFMQTEKENPTFTLTDFKYSFVSVDCYDDDLLLLKDDWNMYLLWITHDKKVERVKGKNGELLTLNRMNYAYNENGQLFVNGSISCPKSTYFCKIVYEDGAFEVSCFAESDEKIDGSAEYYDSDGNVISKREYKKNIKKNLRSKKNLIFKSYDK